MLGPVFMLFEYVIGHFCILKVRLFFLYVVLFWGLDTWFRTQTFSQQWGNWLQQLGCFSCRLICVISTTALSCWPVLSSHLSLMILKELSLPQKWNSFLKIRVLNQDMKLKRNFSPQFSSQGCVIAGCFMGNPSQVEERCQTNSYLGLYFLPGEMKEVFVKYLRSFFLFLLYSASFLPHQQRHWGNCKFFLFYFKFLIYWVSVEECVSPPFLVSSDPLLRSLLPQTLERWERKEESVNMCKVKSSRHNLNVIPPDARFYLVLAPHPSPLRISVRFWEEKDIVGEMLLFFFSFSFGCSFLVSYFSSKAQVSHL